MSLTDLRRADPPSPMMRGAAFVLPVVALVLAVALMVRLADTTDAGEGADTTAVASGPTSPAPTGSTTEGGQGSEHQSLRVVATTPILVADSRADVGVAGLLPAARRRELPVSGIPEDARAVVVRVTVSDAVEPGAFTVWEGGAAPPPQPTLRYGAGAEVVATTVVPVGDRQDLSVRSDPAAVHLLLEVLAYLEGDPLRGFVAGAAGVEPVAVAASGAGPSAAAIGTLSFDALPPEAKVALVVAEATGAASPASLTVTGPVGGRIPADPVVDLGAPADGAAQRVVAVPVAGSGPFDVELDGSGGGAAVVAGTWRDVPPELVEVTNAPPR